MDQYLNSQRLWHTPLLKIELAGGVDGSTFVPMSVQAMDGSIVDSSSWASVVTSAQAGVFVSPSSTLPIVWQSSSSGQATVHHQQTEYRAVASGLVLLITLGDVPIQPIAVEVCEASFPSVCISAVYATIDAMLISRPMKVSVELVPPETAVATLDAASTMACRSIPISGRVRPTLPIVGCVDHGLLQNSDLGASILCDADATAAVRSLAAVRTGAVSRDVSSVNRAAEDNSTRWY